MKKIFAISLLLFAVIVHAKITQKAPPVWPKQYYVEGIFSIPYWDIEQPTIAFYDEINNRQRFDYYNGMDSYIWRWDMGTLWQVVPRIHQMVCFTSTGMGSGPLVKLLPDLTGWVYGGVKDINGFDCDFWTHSVQNLNKTSEFTMYVDTITGNPVQLYIEGYDFVFGSHPDVYVMNYDTYFPNYADDSVYEQPPLCNNSATNIVSEKSGYRAKALLHQLSVLTPRVAKDEFEHFMIKHNKNYEGEEKEYRRSIFMENLRKINQHNSNPDRTFDMGVNHLADFTAEERKMLLRPINMNRPQHADRVHELSDKQIPSSINWVTKGAVNPPPDQGVCGSCWTFGTAGTLESAWFLKTGNLVQVSQQQILDCSWGQWQTGNSGCDGGFAGPALDWVRSNGGIALRSSYPYLMQDSFCQEDIQDSGIQVQGYANVSSGDENALMDAVATHGAIAIAIDAAHDEFEFYSSGVLYVPTCSTTNLDHEVLVVGYGTENGQDYWLVRNSWSTHWGDQGYVKMARNRGNNCGIASQANYPIV